jgi:hypothetical protein
MPNDARVLSAEEVDKLACMWKDQELSGVEIAQLFLTVRDRERQAEERIRDIKLRGIAERDELQRQLAELHAAINPDGTLTEHSQYIQTAQDGAVALEHSTEYEAVERQLDDARINWQPFETAPRDGTEFMGGWANHYCYRTGTPMCWQNGTRRQGWFALSPTYENDNGDFFRGKWINERDCPTHWAPLLKIDAAREKEPPHV